MDLLTANDALGSYPPSYYAAANPIPAQRAAPQGEIRADICVVGGGFTGLSTAYHLAARGYDVVVLEAQRIGFGASGRNGGQVGIGQRLDQITLEDMLGLDHAMALWSLGRQAVQLVRDLCALPEVTCPFHDGIINADHKRSYVSDTRAYVDHLADVYGYTGARALDRAEIRDLVGSPRYHGGMLDLGPGHIDPLRFALELARLAESTGARLFEGARVTKIHQGDPVRVETEAATVTADYLVLACNGYLGGLMPEVARHVMPINNFIAATEPFDPERQEELIKDNRAVADSRFVVNYFRFSDDHRLLFGGGESYGYRFPTDIAALVRRKMLHVYPQLSDTQIDFAWGGTLAITMNRMPSFQRLAGNMLSCSGYSGHGVAMATLAGQIMSEALAGQAERFDHMARVPTPMFPGGTLLRQPLLVLAMLWYGLRDRL